MAKQAITSHYRVTKQNRDVLKKEDSQPSVIQIEEKTALQILREFDLDWKFGPCIGLSRMERWERAQRFELDPPLHVKELMEKNSNDTMYTQCLWDDYTI